MSALTTLLTTAKQTALNSTVGELTNLLKAAENDIESFSIANSQYGKTVQEARSAISTYRSQKYELAFRDYLSILFEEMAETEANAIRQYFTGPVTVVVTGSSGKLICP